MHDIVFVLAWKAHKISTFFCNRYHFEHLEVFKFGKLHLFIYRSLFLLSSIQLEWRHTAYNTSFMSGIREFSITGCTQTFAFSFSGWVLISFSFKSHTRLFFEKWKSGARQSWSLHAVFMFFYRCLIRVLLSMNRIVTICIRSLDVVFSFTSQFCSVFFLKVLMSPAGALYPLSPWWALCAIIRSPRGVRWTSLSFLLVLTFSYAWKIVISPLSSPLKATCATVTFL